MQREIRRTGTQHTGADEYGATTPTLYFGKGLGDVPVGFLRPFAITGQFSYSIADKGLKATPVIDPDTGLTSLQFNNGNSNQWFGGISLQSSIPYLQSQVRIWNCRAFIGRLTPLIEIAWSSPATSPSTQGTTWIVAPGGHLLRSLVQVGVEA